MSYFDDNEDSIIYARRSSAAVKRDNQTCKRCGAYPLRMCFNDNGNWQLCELERGDHNQNVWHQCHKLTADDFEVLE